MASRYEILKRIRYSRRTMYDKPPPHGEQITPGVHEPGPEKKQERTEFLKSRLKAGSERRPQPKKEGGMGGHELIFKHFVSKLKSDDPERLVMHMNQFIDKNRLHRDYHQHMRDAGFHFPGPIGDWPANWVSRRAAEQTGHLPVLTEMANFLEKHNKVAEAKKYIDEEAHTEPGEFNED